MLATPKGADPRKPESVKAWLDLFGADFGAKYAKRCVDAGLDSLIVFTATEEELMALPGSPVMPKFHARKIAAAAAAYRWLFQRLQQLRAALARARRLSGSSATSELLRVRHLHSPR